MAEPSAEEALVKCEGCGQLVAADDLEDHAFVCLERERPGLRPREQSDADPLTIGQLDGLALVRQRATAETSRSGPDDDTFGCPERTAER